MDAGKENAAPTRAAATDKAARDGTVELQQILKSYGDFERCDRWNRESAPIDEEGVLAALERDGAVHLELGEAGKQVVETLARKESKAEGVHAYLKIVVPSEDGARLGDSGLGY